MNIKFSKISKYFFYAISVCLLVYIFYSIGIENIFHAWLTTDFRMVAIAFAIAIAATAIRIYKFYWLLKGRSSRDIIEIFTTSRIGKEVSFAGYFLPLLKKDHRDGNTLQNLIIDRYAEVSATLLLAFISSFFVLNNGRLEKIIFIVLLGALTIFLLLPFVKNPFEGLLRKYAWSNRIMEAVGTLQHKIRVNSLASIFFIYGLSIIVTFLDFLNSFYVFKAYGVAISLFYIAIIWASSAFISMLAFMIIGSTEISNIYLFHSLASISKAIVTSTIVVARLINLVIMALLMLLLSLIRKKTSPIH
jgi:uncharacterized membrane protein YbhN (UPF0104 family)